MNQNNRTVINILFWSMLVYYLLIMVELLFLRVVMDYSRINLIPFETISRGIIFHEGSRAPSIDIQVWANVFVFIPAGLYLMTLGVKHSIPKSFLIVFLSSLGIEILQYILKVGIFDIDDLILNCLGGLLGILFYCLLQKLFKSKEKAKSITTILSLFIGVPYLILELLAHHYN